MAMLPEEEAVIAAAQEESAQLVDQFAQAAPEGVFSEQGLNTVVEALISVLPMFGVEDYPVCSSDIDGMLPGEFVQQLAMVLQAAEDSGLEGMDLDLSMLEDDQDLTLLAGRLQNLSSDVGFKRFLKTSVPEEAEAQEELAPIPDVAPAPEDIDELMLGRM